MDPASAHDPTTPSMYRDAKEGWVSAMSPLAHAVAVVNLRVRSDYGIFLFLVGDGVKLYYVKIF